MKRTAMYGMVLGVAWLGTALPISAADKQDIVQTAVGAGSFKTLAAALDAAGLIDTLKGKGPFTVFAPSDDAFAKLPEGTVETLLKPENKNQLVAILTYHVVPGAVKASDVVKLKGAKTVNGQRVDIVVADKQVKVDGATVVATDIECTNGIIHVLDSVILPTGENIPTVASKAGSFKTLLAAATAAGLVEALSGEGPLTVFAPTDDAFAKLPKGTVESLLKPENKEKLAGILKYHVVSGRIYSEDAVKAASAKTLQGGTIKISASSKGAFINDAKLLKTDIDASNGVIHVIDSVLLPPVAKNAAAAHSTHHGEVTVAQTHSVPMHSVAQGCQGSRQVAQRHRGGRRWR
ncbi:MAG: fasciclin domain-containing protein [Planctomycetales bacterium]